MNNITKLPDFPGTQPTRRKRLKAVAEFWAFLAIITLAVFAVIGLILYVPGWILATLLAVGVVVFFSVAVYKGVE